MFEMKNIAAAVLAVTGFAALGPAQADLGTDTAKLVNLLYQDTRQDCGGSDKPAYMCSGLVMRAVVPTTAYEFYSVSPPSVARGGVSASYLRKDVKFQKTARDIKSGFIFYPVMDNPASHVDYKVLCAYPYDGYTDTRTKNGCGDSSWSASAEDTCDRLGISTAEQWVQHYRKAGTDWGQCGFDVREAASNPAGAFHQFIRASSMINDKRFNGYEGQETELVIAPWSMEAPRAPSLMATFYVGDAGIQASRLSQIQWYRTTRQMLPAIRMQLPQTAQQDATFNYDANAQAILPITAENRCEKYVQSAKWVKRYDPGFRKELMSLVVVPTACGRAIQESQTNNFFNEMVAGYYLQPEWSNNPDNAMGSVMGMRRQLVCLFNTARSKSEWYMEPSRPNTTHAKSIAASCNNTTS